MQQGVPIHCKRFKLWLSYVESCLFKLLKACKATLSRSSSRPWNGHRIATAGLWGSAIFIWLSLVPFFLSGSLQALWVEDYTRATLCGLQVPICIVGGTMSVAIFCHAAFSPEWLMNTDIRDLQWVYAYIVFPVFLAVSRTTHQASSKPTYWALLFFHCNITTVFAFRCSKVLAGWVLLIPLYVYWDLDQWRSNIAPSNLGEACAASLKPPQTALLRPLPLIGVWRAMGLIAASLTSVLTVQLACGPNLLKTFEQDDAPIPRATSRVRLPAEAVGGAAGLAPAASGDGSNPHWLLTVYLTTAAESFDHAFYSLAARFSRTVPISLLVAALCLPYTVYMMNLGLYRMTMYGDEQPGMRFTATEMLLGQLAACLLGRTDLSALLDRLCQAEEVLHDLVPRHVATALLSAAKDAAQHHSQHQRQSLHQHPPATGSTHRACQPGTSGSNSCGSVSPTITYRAGRLDGHSRADGTAGWPPVPPCAAGTAGSSAGGCGGACRVPRPGSAASMQMQPQTPVLCSPDTLMPAGPFGTEGPSGTAADRQPRQCQNQCQQHQQQQQQHPHQHQQQNQNQNHHQHHQHQQHRHHLHQHQHHQHQQHQQQQQQQQQQQLTKLLAGRDSLVASSADSAKRRPSAMSYEATPEPPHIAEWHEGVTVLFADIRGFTDMARQVEPFQVMQFLNRLYHRFDNLARMMEGVYKVETIGDCYMCASGLLQPDEHHALTMLRFAAAMQQAAEEVLLPHSQEPVQIRVGVHSGRVMSGVVGSIRKRYCLFGDTVNTASRLETTGTPGRIHISSDTYLLALRSGGQAEFHFEAREPIEVKGKGVMQTYFVAPRGADNDEVGLEALLLEEWTAVGGLDRVSVTENVSGREGSCPGSLLTTQDTGDLFCQICGGGGSGRVPTSASEMSAPRADGADGAGVRNSVEDVGTRGGDGWRDGLSKRTAVSLQDSIAAVATATATVTTSVTAAAATAAALSAPAGVDGVGGSGTVGIRQPRPAETCMLSDQQGKEG